MVTAALDTGDLATAHEHLEVLRAKFPNSQRVRRLEGMQCEAEGSFSAAAKIYEEMLAANPANSLARKRQVCWFVLSRRRFCLLERLVARFVPRVKLRLHQVGGLKQTGGSARPRGRWRC